MRRLIGGVDDILADADQAAPHRQIVQDAGIIAHIGHGGRGLGQARQIGVAAHFDQAGIGLHRRMQVSGVSTKPPRSTSRAHGLEDARMQRIVEMLRP